MEAATTTPTTLATAGTTTSTSTNMQSNISRQAEGPKLASTPECEVLHEGGADSKELFVGCEKNPGHEKFVPVNDLTIAHLPPEWRTQQHIDHIKLWSDLTVKLSVRYTSPDRPDTYPNSQTPYPWKQFRGSRRKRRLGTGFVVPSLVSHSKVQGHPCICDLCKESGHPKMEYWLMMLATATHVVFDDSEAKRTVAECFFDTEDGQGAQCLYGNRVNKAGGRTDLCWIICFTHDESLVSRLRDVITRMSSMPKLELGKTLGCIISHPHGCCKQIAIGHVFSAKAAFHFQLVPGLPHPFNKSPFLWGNHEENALCRLPPSSKCSIPHIASEECKDVSSSLLECLQQVSTMEEILPNTRVNEILDPSMQCRIFMQPGRLYALPNITSFILPMDTEYAVHLDGGGYEWKINFEENSMWITFPPKTILMFPDRRHVCLQQATDFHWGMMDDIIPQASFVCSFSYDIATCPGSSGARLIYGNCGDVGLTHSGALGSGMNISDMGWFSISVG